MDGNLLVFDRLHATVRRVDAVTGTITRVAGNGRFASSGDGGPATAASLNPFAIAVDAAGNIWIREQSGISTVTFRRVDATTGIITSLVAPFAGGGDVAVDIHGALLAPDFTHHVVYRIDPMTGAATLVAGTPGNGSQGPLGNLGDGGPAVSALLLAPPRRRSIRRATCSSPTRATTACARRGPRSGPASAFSITNRTCSFSLDWASCTVTISFGTTDGGPQHAQFVDRRRDRSRRSPGSAG